ncbi:MAG TPA: hypothetical protein VGS78_01010, partial [Candidatus Sulfotelmatobacter sp.]|nr:hypothetical protein [Candidatus Sulfotelmatobacter sp.]
CYRPLLALRPNLAVKMVTSLEPRTPHQPEKLKKLSKNEYVFTPSIFFVNEKYALISTCCFNRVQGVHNRVPQNSAIRTCNSYECGSCCGFRGIAICEILKLSHVTRCTDCENRALRLSGKGFA